MQRNSKGYKGSVYIGWKETDITPEKPAALAGQFFERVSEYVHDPITATALAIETRDENGASLDQVIMVSCDLICIEKQVQDLTRAKVSESIPDFDPGKLFMNATHIHTGPFTSEGPMRGLGGKGLAYRTKSSEVVKPSEYVEFLTDRLSDAAVKAWQSRQAGGVSRELGFAVIGHNRMVLYDDGSGKLYGNTDTVNYDTLMAPSDHGIELLFFWNQAKELSGVAINVACPSQVLEMKRYITADFWYEVRKGLRQRYGDNIFILPMTGAAGDQSPRDMVRGGRGEPDMNEEAGAKEIAKRIINALEDVFESARERIEEKAVLRHRTANISLPVRKVGRAEAMKAEEEYRLLLEKYGIDPEQSYFGDNLSDDAKFRLSYLYGLVDRYQDQQVNPFYNMELHVLRIGDAVIATNPFEMYIDYGLRIKALSKAQQTFIVQLACDIGGYLPTARAISAGGYSTCVFNGIVGPEGGRQLVEHTVMIINELMDGDGNE